MLRCARRSWATPPRTPSSSLSRGSCSPTSSLGSCRRSRGCACSAASEPEHLPWTAAAVSRLRSCAVSLQVPARLAAGARRAGGQAEGGGGVDPVGPRVRGHDLCPPSRPLHHVVWGVRRECKREQAGALLVALVASQARLVRPLLGRVQGLRALRRVSRSRVRAVRPAGGVSFERQLAPRLAAAAAAWLQPPRAARRAAGTTARQRCAADTQRAALAPGARHSTRARRVLPDRLVVPRLACPPRALVRRAPPPPPTPAAPSRRRRCRRSPRARPPRRYTCPRRAI